jgi:hypothetical protein
MTDWYKLAENQKLLDDIDILEQDLQALQRRALSPPCITIRGFDKLQICSMIRPSAADLPFKDVIHKLFMMMKIPYFWIYSIEPSRGHAYHLPSTVNIYLIKDSIRMAVYIALLQYLKKTDQKTVSVKLLT